jgi:hypothetical protein
MEYLIGCAVALGVCLFALFVGFDRDRVFYPAVVMVVAHYYILFAAMGSDTQSLLVECVPAVAFIAVATLGFQRSPWFAVAGLVGHGVFDFFHGQLIRNPGVPVWWPGFCLSFDVLAGIFLAALLMHRSKTVRFSEHARQPL